MNPYRALYYETEAQQTEDVERDYLRRSKRSTPEQKRTWLAAARDLVIATRKK